MPFEDGAVASKRVDNPEIEISWRTAELGPELRRALFKQAHPSIKLAAAKEPPEARRESKTGERPRQRRSNDKSK
jgi:hypothetical protein